jgi:Meiotically up-regulated gene 113
LHSDRVNVLSTPAEVFYRRLMSIVDDYGRCEYVPKLFIPLLYPLRVKDVSENDIREWVKECETAHLKCGEEEPLINVYKVGRKNYIQINNFGQRARTESKYPGPDQTTQQSKREGSVYFLRSGTSGKIKIGFTMLPPAMRLNALQTGASERLELLGFIKGSKMLERELHVRFAPFRLNGEWFEASEEILGFLERECARNGAQMRASAARASTPPPTAPPPPNTPPDINFQNPENCARAKPNGSFESPDDDEPPTGMDYRECFEELVEAYPQAGRERLQQAYAAFMKAIVTESKQRRLAQAEVFREMLDGILRWKVSGRWQAGKVHLLKTFLAEGSGARTRFRREPLARLVRQQRSASREWRISAGV